MAIHEPNSLEVLVTRAAGALVHSVYEDYVNSLELRGDERVLDFGSGAGAPARYLADRLLPGGGQLTCLDISHVWLDVCRQHLHDTPNVTFVLGDITTLDLPPASFDAVFIHFVLHDIPAGERLPIVAALARVLTPDGRVFIREPKRFIAPGEVKALWEAEGLTETSRHDEHIASQGEVYAGVYARG